MEGRVPVHGSPVQMDIILAGTDPVATDSTAARIMGFNPRNIAHIRMAHEKGLIETDDVEVVGDNIEDVRRIFKRP